MACGGPIIAPNISSLPEVVGEAGLLVDPYDVEALAQAISTVLKDDDLKREMSVKSVAQARSFSWAPKTIYGLLFGHLRGQSCELSSYARSRACLFPWLHIIPFQ